MFIIYTHNGVSHSRTGVFPSNTIFYTQICLISATATDQFKNDYKYVDCLEKLWLMQSCSKILTFTGRRGESEAIRAKKKVWLKSEDELASGGMGQRNYE